MSDSQAADPVNETSVPESEAREKKRSPLDLATVAGVVGAVVGALVTWAVNLGVVWQATATFIGAVLCGGFALLYRVVVFSAEGGPKAHLVEKRFVRFSVWYISVAAVMAVMGALVAALLGAPLKSPAIIAALFVGVTLFALAIAVPLIVLLHKVTPPRVRPVVFAALLGCVLGSRLWDAWFQVGWLNLGIPVVGIPMALAFIFVILWQASKASRS